MQSTSKTYVDGPRVADPGADLEWQTRTWSSGPTGRRRLAVLVVEQK